MLRVIWRVFNGVLMFIQIFFLSPSATMQLDSCVCSLRFSMILSCLLLSMQSHSEETTQKSIKKSIHNNKMCVWKVVWLVVRLGWTPMQSCSEQKLMLLLFHVFLSFLGLPLANSYNYDMTSSLSNARLIHHSQKKLVCSHLLYLFREACQRFLFIWWEHCLNSSVLCTCIASLLLRES